MTGNSISLRPATADDLENIRACAVAAYSKYLSRMDREPAPMHADFAHYIALGQVQIALVESLFAGYVVFFSQQQHVQLENIAVLPEQAGKGVGKALFDFVETFAQDNGFTAIRLYTNEAMTENLDLYARAGYVETERKTEAGFNRVFFQKLL